VEPAEHGLNDSHIPNPSSGVFHIHPARTTNSLEGIVWGSEETTPDFMALGPNKWPSEAECPGYRSEMMQCYNDWMVLGRALFRILALGLRLPELLWP